MLDSERIDECPPGGHFITLYTKNHAFFSLLVSFVDNVISAEPMRRRVKRLHVALWQSRGEFVVIVFVR